MAAAATETGVVLLHVRDKRSYWLKRRAYSGSPKTTSLVASMVKAGEIKPAVESQRVVYEVAILAST